jgi:formiminotetrahydrofolate cyclodeaminase
VGVKDETIEEFLARVAAPTPTPGGGSVSALAGALSAALSRMVAGLARGKKGYEAAERELAEIEARGRVVQSRLEALVEEDARAYDAVIAAMRLPKSSEPEREARVAAMQAAYRRATEVPLETMERCVEALELAEAAAKKGNRGATTDAAVAVLLAESAVRGASLNCAVNLASIRDESFRSQAEEKVEHLLKRADEIGHEAMAVVTERL